MKSTLLSRGALLTVVAGLTVTLSACGADEPVESSAAPGTSSSSAAPEDDAEDASDEPFGVGCSAVPAEGEGSFAGMIDDPVGTAAGNNPTLSLLVQSVRQADLLDSVNGLQDVTVLAPANPAFKAVPKEDIDALLADTAQLTAVLTHHVIQGRLTPDQLAGTHTTLNNDEVTIAGSGEDFTVPVEGTLLGRSEARVLCGNVQTANATVYVIDQVLAPPTR